MNRYYNFVELVIIQCSFANYANARAVLNFVLSVILTFCCLGQRPPANNTKYILSKPKTAPNTL